MNYFIYSLFYFLYYWSWCLWWVTPLSEIKSKEVFDNIDFYEKWF